MTAMGLGRVLGILMGACLLWLIGGVAWAADYEQFFVDLDGSGTAQTVTLSTDGTEAIQDFTVKVGPWDYKGKFFGFEGDMPEMSIIRIDGARPARQILVKAPQPASCIFHILGYANQKLVSLLTHDSGLNCHPPQPNANGALSVYSWQGFWLREEKYSLDPAGTALTPLPQETYDVDATGAASHALTLEPAGCPATAAPAGSFVRVTRFNPTTERFLLEVRGGACGWIRRDEIGAALEELPWKGEH